MTNPFDGAAPYYAKYRPGHGEAAIGCLARAFGPGSRVLDLGCGPGTVAIPLAPAVHEVIAVDPDAGMLAEGGRVAAGSPNIRWLSGDSTTLAGLPPFDDVVMGRSFHWMDRRAVLAELDRLLPPEGAVALVGPSRDPGEHPWEPVVRLVRAAYASDEPKAVGSFQSSGEHHHDVLVDSPFDRVESSLFEQRLSWDLDAVLGLQLSYSYTTPTRLGDRVAEFVDAVREVLLADNPSGVWQERTVTEVLIARRS
ncbi:class I SAM-dependent methyltransferase [Nonomuraea guangzhouensis]|uniref:Class I SAM-dependent methyltransferase n=1 Tax=Nonomuraea guangzhouensis TaxID=1291555 RepID=A0ABW4G5P4_9ACTN|nr:class I SAM-dependent methyltransferase [Nonomuraea guangzhouensis]